MRQIELVDRHGRVVHQMPFDDSAFPLTVRIADGAAEPVASAAFVSSPASTASRWTDRGRALIAAAVTVLIFGLIVWARTFSSARGASAISGTLMFLMLVAAYAGMWALGGRIAKHRARFARHFTWACGVALAFTALSYLVDVALFFAPASPTYVPLGLLWIVLGVVAIAGQLGIASAMPRPRRFRVAGVAVACMLALAALGAYSDWDDFDTKIRYVGNVQPFSASLIPAQSPDDFAKSLDGMKTQLDRAVTKH